MKNLTYFNNLRIKLILNIKYYLFLYLINPNHHEKTHSILPPAFPFHRLR